MNPTIKQYYELTYEQLALNVLAALQRKLGQTDSKVVAAIPNGDIEPIRSEQAKRFVAYVDENLELLRDTDLVASASDPEYKVTTARQKELTFALVGKSYCYDDLSALVVNERLRPT